MDGEAKGNVVPNSEAATGNYEDYVKRFRQELVVAGYTPRTLSTYTENLKHFLSHTQKKPEEMEREDIISYIAHLKEDKNASNATLALNVSVLKFFFHNFLRKHIVEDIKIPKKAKKLPTVLTVKEVKDLIKAVPAGRDRCIVEFLYSSGVRVSESVNMKLEDLNLKEGFAKVKGGKGNKDRIIILSKAWAHELKKYLKKKRAPTEYVFSKKNGKPLSVDTVQRVIRQAREKAGIAKQVTPHTLRHSFGTHLLESGENIRKIQELLGHANISTTQIYTHVSAKDLVSVESPLDRLRGRPRTSTNQAESEKSEEKEEEREE